MFAISNGAAGDNTGGITFEDLTFQYQSPPGTFTNPPAAIHLLSGGSAENIRAVRCIFQDCPVGLLAEDGLQISVLQCLFKYDENAGTAIILGNAVGGDAAKEVFITDCLFSVGPSGPKGSTGLNIQGSDEIFVHNTHIDGFTYGILIMPGPTGHNAVHLNFTACTVYTGPDANGNLGKCCLIQPQPASPGVPGATAVAQVVFTGCFFELTAQANITGTKGPGILVDASSGQVNTVRFVSCYSARWPGPGLQINGVTTTPHLLPANIEVLGGMYAGNNTKPTGSANSYGIWVKGAQNVRIVGALCLGSYQYIDIANQSSSPTQDGGILVDSNASSVIISGCMCDNNNLYGVYVNGGASDVIIDACDVRGGTNGIVVNGATTAVTDIFIRNCNARGSWAYNTAIAISGPVANISNVEVTDCAGYNDQGVHLTPTGGPISGATFNGSNFGYFGPITFYAWPSVSTITQIAVQGINTHLLSGMFYVAAGSIANAAISYTGTPLGLGLVVIGQ